MSVNIRLPNIDGTTSAQQLAQIKSYLYQLANELDYSLKNMEGSSPAAAANAPTSSSLAEKHNEAVSTFNSIKSLIIKSADVVNAYYEEINKRLEGVYVAESDFGVYVEETANAIKATSDSVTQFYTNLQTIIADIDTLEDSVVKVNARIKTGLLYYGDDGAPVYGLEIGQRTEIDDVEVFNKYARFTSDKLSFYDQNENEVAYISDKKLYITHVEVTGRFTLGGFVDTIQGDGSVVTKWVGGGS